MPGSNNLKLAASLTVIVMTASARAVTGNTSFVETWGYNADGELGNGTTINSATPVPVTGMTGGVTAIAAGDVHLMAIKNGAAYAWGNNGIGQLGNGTTINSTSPVPVTNMSGGVTAIAGGNGYSLAVQNGGLFAWGDNAFSQLGNGTTTNSPTPTPVPVTNMSSGVTAIAAAACSLAIQNGAAYAWGYNGAGQLGNGTTANSATPVPITNMSSGVTAVATGDNFSLAIKNGALYGWGYNGQGELGNGTTINSTTPVAAVTNLSSGVTAIAAGGMGLFCLAVKNGDVYAWGGNGEGNLGDGTTNGHVTPEQIDPADLNHIVAIAAGSSSSYALSADGSLWVWGYNNVGQLGLGTTVNDYLTPQHLLPPAGYEFTSINAGTFGSDAIATVAPVPEPTTFPLLALVTTALLTRRRSLRLKLTGG